MRTSTLLTCMNSNMKYDLFDVNTKYMLDMCKDKGTVLANCGIHVIFTCIASGLCIDMDYIRVY